MAEGKVLAYFETAFGSLKRDKSKGEAPHKPVLLLSILHEYEAGRILSNKVFITPELTRTFSNYWNALVSSAHEKRFALPFYHLKGEKGNWWRLQAIPGCESWLQNAGSMRTFANLTAAVAYAELDSNLTTLLLSATTRQTLRQKLLTTYFPQRRTLVITDDSGGYVQGLESEIVSENRVEYKAVIDQIFAAANEQGKRKLDPEKYEIEVYNRSAVFRREVVKLYNEACCISGLRVSALFTITMVDACHIRPFANSFDNTLSNGIALCPNLHRAFDRGLLTVDDNYQVVLASSFAEEISSVYSFSKVAGAQLRLPADKRHMPNKEAFAWHRQHIFQG